MSYIRCLSNPEGIYIWGDGVHANIAVKAESLKLIPQKVFDGLLRKCYKDWSGDVKYKGARIQEVFIKDKKQSKKAKKFKIKDGKFQMRLSYKDWHIDMWSVTWNYIINHEGRKL